MNIPSHRCFVFAFCCIFSFFLDHIVLVFLKSRFNLTCDVGRVNFLVLFFGAVHSSSLDACSN
jgi:hypothetical protein